MSTEDLRPSPQSELALYRQLYERFRAAIACGKLQPGDRVPSIRSLASELNLARGTVELAYQILSSEGYLVSHGAAGTLVSPELSGAVLSPPRPSAVAEPDSHPLTTSGAGLLQPGLPALDAFPHSSWTRLAGRNLRALHRTGLLSPDVAGYAPLRQALASYLAISRGIHCSAEQIFITAGYRGALDLICRTLLQPGDSGWFENPGYRFAREFLQHSGMQLHSVPVDQHGLVVEQGIEQHAGARFAVVTPTHQSPTGVTLSLARRLELLRWASQHQAWIIEDDYDSEFRYQGQPLPALKSLDHDDRVLYSGTFSKVLFPGLRLAYLVVPAALVSGFRASAGWLPGAGHMHLQATVADFMAQGHFARHLRRMRTLYAQRRQYLVSAIGEVFGKRLSVDPAAGGIHILARLPPQEDDRLLVRRAQKAGFALQALNDWRTEEAEAGGLIMGFTNIAGADAARALARQLLAATDSA
ncbi:MAG: PLP-dependent aminotransferase family protein [Pseudomonadota bacterium]|nr:PLP-dependent aminotransferase family protein [Pseudomonadota bacterium]